MSDDSKSQRKSLPPPVPTRRSVPPAAAEAPMPSGGRLPKSTTRMTADEIADMIANNRANPAPPGAASSKNDAPPKNDASAKNDAPAAEAKPEGFDPERTMVLDPDEDGVEDATVDYDPRARQNMRSAPAPAGTAMPAIPPAPRVPSLTQPAAKESLRDTKKRSSRRTVKIPDDPVRPTAARAPVIEVPKEASFDAPETYSDLAETAAHPRAALPFAADAGAADVHFRPLTEGTSNDATEVRPPAIGVDAFTGDLDAIRPLRIINIGSEPPRPNPLQNWPTDEPSIPPSATTPDSGEAETVRRAWPSVTKTDLLPPAIPEDGWTPAPPAVAVAVAAAPAVTAQVASVDEVSVEEAALEDAPAVQVSEEQELIEDIEPDAAPVPAKKPPPPPPKGREAASKRELGPESIEPIKKPKPWFEDLFSEDYIKTMDVLPESEVLREVDFIEERLGVEKQGVILDLACGRGEHAIELAARGYNVVGLDLSPVALAIAHENLRARAAQGEMGGKPSFMRTDMRELNFEENFDGAYCWSTSFGYFDDDVNVGVLKRLHRALRQGGNLIIDVANRDFIAPRAPSLVWFEGDRCTCMDEMQVDFLTSRLRVKRTAMFEDGHSRELEYSMRLYSLDALARMLRETGFRVVEVTGLIAHPGVFFGSESPRLIVLAERT